MKTHAAALAAATITVASLPANLTAVATGQAGIKNLLMTLLVVASWVIVSVVCRHKRAVTYTLAAFIAAMMIAVFAGVFSPGLIAGSASASLAWMLLLCPMWGFCAIVPGINEALALGFAACTFAGAMCLLAPRVERIAQDLAADLAEAQEEA